MAARSVEIEHDGERCTGCVKAYAVEYCAVCGAGVCTGCAVVNMDVSNLRRTVCPDCAPVTV